MPISPYLKALRAKIGHDCLLLPGVAAVIRDSSEQILLHRRSDTLEWDLPGGSIDPGEPPALTLVREVWEETGLKVEPVGLAGVFGGRDAFIARYPNGDVVEYVDILFHCRIVGGDLVARDDESLELRFFDPAVVSDWMAHRYPKETFASFDVTRPALFD